MNDRRFLLINWRANFGKITVCYVKTRIGVNVHISSGLCVSPRTCMYVFCKPLWFSALSVSPPWMVRVWSVDGPCGHGGATVV